MCGSHGSVGMFTSMCSPFFLHCRTVCITGTKAVMEHFNLRLALTPKRELDARSYRTLLDKLQLKLWEDILKCERCCTHTVHVYSIDGNLQLLFCNIHQNSANAHLSFYTIRAATIY